MKIQKIFHRFHALCVASLFLAANSVSAQTLGLQLYAGVNITGTAGSVNAIQTTTNVADPNSWSCVALVQLPSTNYLWVDTSSGAASGQRFYRAVQTATNLVFILPGTFTMGSPASEALRGSDEVQHVVTITKGFYMGKYLVTQTNYVSVMGSNPSHFNTNSLTCPVEGVSWLDASNYCAVRTAQERAAGLIPTNWVYRLPTESEWEYACRAGTATALFLGSTLHSQQANFAGTTEYDSTAGSISNPSGVYLQTTVPVGNYAPNGWGLYDMAGNVFEWCQDWYGAYPTGSVTNDPQGPVTGSNRVYRGGGWPSSGYLCRSAQRNSVSPSNKTTSFGFYAIGFRVVLAPAQ